MWRRRGGAGPHACGTMRVASRLRGDHGEDRIGAALHAGTAPPPAREFIEPRQLSDEEAHIGQIKRAYNDGRKEVSFNREQDEIRAKIHNLSGQAKGKKKGK